jgi:dTMP kinase
VSSSRLHSGEAEKGKRLNRGLFITLEGPEGAGKSLQAERIREALQAEGIPCIVTREPGGAPAAEAIRKVVLHEKLPPLAEALLFLAARAVHVQEVIRPALNEGVCVICDRFTDSTIAYQGYGLGLDLDSLRWVCKYATEGLEPDLTLLLDLPPEIGILRRYGREGEAGGKKRGSKHSNEQLSLALEEQELQIREAARSRIEERGLSFHRRVREGFLEEARLNPHRFRVVDANRPPDEITEELLEHVRQALAERGFNA